MDHPAHLSCGSTNKPLGIIVCSRHLLAKAQPFSYRLQPARSACKLEI